MSVRQIKNLLFKSAQLQQQIEREQNKFVPDKYRLLKLRELRLIVSERLYRFFKPAAIPAYAMAKARTNKNSLNGRPAWDC
jgi:hypothetical protein